jgi:predicted glycosyltransferase
MPDQTSGVKPDRPIGTRDGDLGSTDAGPSILEYGPADAAGLGHLRRNTNIALRFARETLSGNALVIGSWPAGLSARLAPGVDFVKLPSVQRTAGRTWRPSSLRIGLRRLLALRSSIIVTLLETFEPDIFLVDHLPLGYCGELQPALDLLKRSSLRTKMVLGLRDILDAPGVIHHAWESNGIYDALERYYDLILIYGDPAVFDAAAQYGLIRAQGPRVKYCGYVGSDVGPDVGPDAPDLRASIPNQSAPARAKRILITGGGGFDAYPMMSMCIAAIHLMSREYKLDCVLICGPLMDGAERESVEKKAAGLPIIVIPYVDKPLDYMLTADLVIGMAGYNTIVEAVALGKKMLVIPRSGPSAEQSMRADIFAAKGYLTSWRLEGSSPKLLAEAIWRSLESEGPARGKPDLNGLATVVAELRTAATGNIS